MFFHPNAQGVAQEAAGVGEVGPTAQYSNGHTRKWDDDWAAVTYTHLVIA